MSLSKLSLCGIGLLLCPLALSCGGRSELAPPGATSTCPEPSSEAPEAGSLELPPGSGYTKFHMTFHNRCAQTIWPAWVRKGGFDVTVPDPSFWDAIDAGESHVVDMYGGSPLEIAVWGRTRCSFDSQGDGSCETGDCGQFLCTTASQDPNDATVFRWSYGFGPHYNVPLAVASPGCDAQECHFDIAQCAEATRIEGACGVAACTNICPSSSACCHEYSNSCYLGGDIDVTFCP